jgi:hypothetical protein
MIVRKKKRTGGLLELLLVITVLLNYGCNPAEEKPSVQPEPAAQQPVLPPVPPKVSINAVMVALVDHASHVIWDAGDPKKGPKSDRDWGELEHHAIQLAASGSLIALGGTGKADAGWIQQANWKKLSQDLSDAGVAALDAVRIKDRVGLSKAGDQLVVTCETCHKEFKPDAPTEGIVHPHDEPAATEKK